MVAALHTSTRIHAVLTLYKPYISKQQNYINAKR